MDAFSNRCVTTFDGVDLPLVFAQRAQYSSKSSKGASSGGMFSLSKNFGGLPSLSRQEFSPVRGVGAGADNNCLMTSDDSFWA
jgi:hypothetical protein